MRNLIRLRDRRYPITEADFVAVHWRLTVPAYPDDQFYRRYGYAIVYHSEPPAYNPDTQHVLEIAPAPNQNGTWRQRWEIKSYTPEELAAMAEEGARKAADIVARQEIVASAIIGLSYAQLDSYIDANVTDLAKARTYLKKLSRVVKALVERI